MKLPPALLPAAAVTVTVAGALVGLVAPPDRLQGNLQKLMYVHVPAAWLAYLSFAVTLVGSVLWLWRGAERSDRVAAAAAEVGVFFTGLAIVMGSVWAKPVWGVWWTWDPRLITTALLFFVYLGYLAVRRATPQRTDRARRSAIFGLVAFVQVPIVHFSVLWWRTLHQPPTVLRPGDPTIDHVMLAALAINVLGFSLLWLWLLRSRIALATESEAVEDAQQVADGELAGRLIDRPLLREPGTSV